MGILPICLVAIIGLGMGASDWFLSTESRAILGKSNAAGLAEFNSIKAHIATLSTPEITDFGSSLSEWITAAGLSSTSYRGPSSLAGRLDMTVVNDDQRQTSCIVHLRKTDRRIYVAFRGTKNMKDMKANVSTWRSSPQDKPFDGLVHAGFLSSYGALHNKVVAELTKHREDFQTITLTGHSLGGAMATIAVPILKRLFKDKDIDCITFGAPRVGNRDFVESFRRSVRFVDRIVNKDDVVVKLPPGGFFHHVAPPSFLCKGCMTSGGCSDPAEGTNLSRWLGISGHLLKEYLRRLELVRRDAIGFPEQCTPTPVVRL